MFIELINVFSKAQKSAFVIFHEEETEETRKLPTDSHNAGHHMPTFTRIYPYVIKDPSMHPFYKLLSMT